MSKRKATSNSTRHAKDALSIEQLRIRHTEMLNASFFRWIQEQHANHRTEFWRNGLEEYLQYGKSIQDRFPIASDSQTAAFGNHSDLAAQPKAKLSRFAPPPSDNGKQKPSAFSATGAAAPGVSGTAAAAPLPASTSMLPTINFASAPAAAATSSSTLTASAFSVNKRPELPAFEPKADWEQPQSSSGLSSPPSVPPLTSNSTNGASSVPFGSPSAFLLLSAEPKAAFKASTDAAAASTSVSSLFGTAPSFLMPTPSSNPGQPGSRPAFGAAQTQPAFGSSIFPASASLPAASSIAGQPAVSPPFSLPPLSGSSQQPSIAAPAPLSFTPWQPGTSPAPATGSQSALVPAFSFPSAQPGSLPAFNIGSGSAPFGATASSNNPSTAPAPFQPPTLNFSPFPVPSFSAGVAAPFGFGSQPAASTSHTDAADAQPSSTSSFNFNAAPAMGASGASLSAPFSWTAPSASAPAAMPSLGAANGSAGSGGFSFNLPSSAPFGAGGLGGFVGQNGVPPFPQATGTAEEEEQQEAEAPTEYAQDEGVIVSQKVKWRHKKDEASWEKTAKGRLLARKSGKGAVYLQFVTTSGQVVSTANIAAELKQHGTTPALLVGVLYVSVRHAHDKAEDTWDDPVPKMTLITCSSEASAKEFVTKLSEAKAAAIV